MTPETPAREETLYARRKAQYPVVFWFGMVASVFAHWAVFRSAPTFSVEVTDFAATELTAVELPPHVDIPPPPNAIARPAMPVISKAVISQDITISLTTFESFVPAALPPPPATAIPEEAWSDTPTFTPFTVAPRLENPEEATRAILANYPRMLRDVGIGGTALMWFYIDETGKVLQTRVAKSSGYDALDAAASAVAEVLVFSPAYNRDMAAKVWVQIPIQFNVRAR